MNVKNALSTAFGFGAFVVAPAVLDGAIAYNIKPDNIRNYVQSVAVPAAGRVYEFQKANGEACYVSLMGNIDSCREGSPKPALIGGIPMGPINPMHLFYMAKYR